MPRIPFVPETPADKAVADVFLRLRRRWQDAPVLHLYRLLGWAPGLVGPWLDFSSALRFRVTSPAHLRELMIVHAGQLLGAEYEWKHHWVMAREAGVSEQKLEALTSWRTSTLFDDDERTLLAVAEDTALGTGATPETMRALTERFPTEQVVEIITTATFYSGVGRLINSLQVPLEPGFEKMTPKDDEA